MRKDNLLKTISKNRLTIPVTLLIGTCFSVLSFCKGHLLGNSATLKDEYIKSIIDFAGTDFYLLVIQWLIMIITGILLLLLNDAYSLIKGRSPWPFVIFYLFVNLSPLSFFNIGSLISLSIIILMFILFNSYQRERPEGSVYLTGVIIASTALIWSPFLLFIPIFIIGIYQMRIMNFRSILAMISGLVTPFWLFICWPGYHGGWNIYNLSPDFIKNLTFSKLHIPDLNTLIYALTIISIGIIGSASTIIHNYSEKIKTQAYNNFIINIFILTIVIALINFENISIYLDILLIPVSLLVANYFSTNKSKIASVIFYLIFSILILTYSNNIWMVLSN